MGAQKHSSKVGGGGYVGGFLQLFEWNGKSRKKLTYSKLELPEGIKKGKRSDENLPMTQFHLNDKYEDDGFIPRFKRASDYSCASSSTDDEGNVSRPPGVVARLMGLDSLPVSGVTEPYGTPLFKPQSLQNVTHIRKPFERGYQSNILDNQPSEVDSFRRRASETRPQKMLNSPIERFQSETLRPRSVKPHQSANHKLLSPIKNPGFISPKNVAAIMEAAEKILEPGYQPSSKGRSLSTFGSSKVRDVKNQNAAYNRPSRHSETPKSSAESSTAKYLKEQSSSKTFNGPGDVIGYQEMNNSDINLPVGLKNGGKSISLAIQAKVNVQRRDSLNSCGNKSVPIVKEEGHSLNLLLKNQPRAPRNLQNKSSAAKAEGVLRQNNQKQNCPPRKDKLPLKLSKPNQQTRKVLSGDDSSGRNRTFNKFNGNSRVGKKAGSEMADLENEVLFPRAKGYSRKKRVTNGDFQSEKIGFVHPTFMATGHEKLAKNEQHLNWAEDSRRKGMDVVSFTFTSPMIKSTAASRSSSPTRGNQNTYNACILNPNDETSTTASMSLNLNGNDALSILLEQKLRQLTSGMDSSSCSSPGKMETNASFMPTIEDFADKSRSSICSMKGQVLKVKPKFQVSRRAIECSASSDDQMELDFQPSPNSIFEASFSHETCNSSESLGSNSGNMCSSSVHAQNIIGSEPYLKKILRADDETELCDSACSPFIETVDSGMGIEKRETDYIKAMLHNTELKFSNILLSHASNLIDPCLFVQLKNQKIELRNDRDDRGCKLNQRELFDFVREFIDTNHRRYTRVSYKTWAKGAAFFRKERLADEIYKEVSLWRRMGEWMVDDIVDWDMSNQLGRWLDFEVEALETGEDIEKEILSSLVDEVVADMLS